MFALLILSTCVNSLNAVLYDCYTGEPASELQIQAYAERNNTQYCLLDVDPCDPDEWRRVDGACNSLKWPAWGMPRTPFVHLLPRVFSNKNYDPRKAKDGKPLPLPRYLSTELLPRGKRNDLYTTQLVSYYLTFIGENDVVSIHDIFNYLINTTNCCEKEGKSNYICAPNKMPIGDPVHRFSEVTCQNLTKPQSFQYFGCAKFGTTPFARISYHSPIFDISGIYSPQIGAINNIRTFEKGLLKTEEDNGMIFPPANPIIDPRINLCLLNQLPKETRCHHHLVSGVFGSNILSILLYRLHNYIAKELAILNPCWDDERLFYTAYDINVAINAQIVFYELMPVVLGERNLIKDGILLRNGGFRDRYNEDIPPKMSDEFVYILRWFHTMQESDLKMYDTNGYYLRTIPMLNLTARTGFFPLDNNLAEMYQGSFRQFGGGFDNVVDFNMAEAVVGPGQFASDVFMNDIAKGRQFGFQPYVKYREFCAKRPYKTFESLYDVMSEERIYGMKKVYDHVEDIDLMAGIYGERLMPGSRVPYTIYCLMVEQFKRTLVSDRHWYERRYRPHAFSDAQLNAVRNIKMSTVMCLTADGVTKIQPSAFYTISAYNPLIDCSLLKIDLSPWKDSKC